MQPFTKEPTPPPATHVEGSTKSLEVEDVLEPLNFDKPAAAVFHVTRSLERQLKEEAELKEAEEEKLAVVENEDDVPLIQRKTRKGKRPMESLSLPPTESKRPRRVTTAKKPEPASAPPSQKRKQVKKVVSTETRRHRGEERGRRSLCVYVNK